MFEARTATTTALTGLVDGNVFRENLALSILSVDQPSASNAGVSVAFPLLACLHSLGRRTLRRGPRPVNQLVAKVAEGHAKGSLWGIKYWIDV